MDQSPPPTLALSPVGPLVLRQPKDKSKSGGQGRRGPTSALSCRVQALLEFGEARRRARPPGGPQLGSRCLRPGAATSTRGWTWPQLPSAPARARRAFVGPQCDPAERGETAPDGHPAAGGARTRTGASLPPVTVFRERLTREQSPSSFANAGRPVCQDSVAKPHKSLLHGHCTHTVGEYQLAGKF